MELKLLEIKTFSTIDKTLDIVSNGQFCLLRGTGVIRHSSWLNPGIQPFLLHPLGEKPMMCYL